MTGAAVLAVVLLVSVALVLSISLRTGRLMLSTSATDTSSTTASTAAPVMINVCSASSAEVAACSAACKRPRRAGVCSCSSTDAVRVALSSIKSRRAGPFAASKCSIALRRCVALAKSSRTRSNQALPGERCNSAVCAESTAAKSCSLRAMMGPAEKLPRTAPMAISSSASERCAITWLPLMAIPAPPAEVM